MHHASLSEHRHALDTKQYSSVELTKYYLQRIANHDSSLNAFVTVTEAQALKQAAEADALIARKEVGPLTGIPIAYKDNLCIRDTKTSCSSKMLDNFIAPFTATLVEKLENAGCVMLGKTNMDEFAMGSSTENSFYGPTKNPWNTGKIPGGSSGGSAAAIAARLAPAAIGSDTGGSIRQPAALCGVTGMKPTYGRISRYGMVAFASSLDQAGPIAQTVEDLAQLLNVMCAYDPKDSTSMLQGNEDFTQQLQNTLKGKIIGLPDEYFTDACNQNVQQAIHEAIKVLKNLGASCRRISLPSTSAAIVAYYIIAPAEASSNLARFDGVRYGHRCANPTDLNDLYKRSRQEGFGEEVKRRILTGTYVLSAGYYDAYYQKAQQVRRLISNEFQSALSEVDLILGPTTPDIAFDIGSTDDDPIRRYLADIYTVSVNLAGLPALSIPVGFHESCPIGMQLIGKPLQEGTLLNVAHQYQLATNWHQKMPANFD